MSTPTLKTAYVRGWTACQNLQASHADTAWELFCSDYGIDPETGEECEHPEDQHEEESSEVRHNGSLTVYTVCGVCGYELNSEETSVL